MKKSTAGIILAAGISSRLGQPKQLLKLYGKCVLEWVIDASLKSNLEQIYIVLGHKYQAIVNELEKKMNHPQLQVLINPKYKQGQSGSLRIGIMELKKQYSSAMILLGDQPLLGSEIIDCLLYQYWASEKDILCPDLSGKKKKPCYFQS